MDREFETNPTTERQLQAERLQTEYSFEDSENVEERLACIRTQLKRWWLLGLAGFFSCIFFLVSLSVPFPLPAFLIPFIINDCYLAGVSLRPLLAKSEPRLFRVHVKGTLENFSTITFKVLLCAYLTCGCFDLWQTGLPLFAVAIFRVAYRGSAGVECWVFSGMFRVAFRIVRIIAIITISMKVDDYADYSWLSALWPLWVSLSLLVLISIGVLLLLVGSFCSWMMNECERGEVLCSLWLLFATGGFCASSGFCLLIFAQVHDGKIEEVRLGQAMIMPVVYFAVFLVWTHVMETRLVSWWDSFFTPQEDEHEVVTFTTVPQTPAAGRSRHASRQFTTLIASAPRMLTRISSTFFKPAKSRREKRTRPQSLVNPHIFDKVHDDVKVLSVSTLEVEGDEVSANETHDKSASLKTCLVCYEGVSNAVIMPCGHSGICASCSVQLWKQTGQCHLCRKRIESVLEIATLQGNIAQVMRTTCEKSRDDQDKNRVEQE